MVRCYKCGALAQDSTKFCPQCGAVLKCPGCGTPLHGEKFCPNCGKNTTKGQSKAGAAVSGAVDKVKHMDKKKLRNILIVALVIVALLVCIIVPSVVLTNKFRKAKVSKVEIGMSEQQVRDILGNPDEEITRYADAWVWYQKKAKKQIDKMNDSFDSDDFEGALDGMDKAYSKLEKMSYKSIVVEFENDKVSGVALNMDTKYDDSLFGMNLYACHKVKTVKSFELSKNSFNVNESLEDAQIFYTATYKDGSYRKAYLSHAEHSDVDLSKAGVQALKVNDEWGNYTAQIAVAVPQNGVFSGVRYERNSDGQSYSAAGLADTSISGLVIQNMVFGLPVTNIKENAFRDCTGITAITIPDSVTYIGSSAFGGCTGITAIIIPDSVTNISSSAFDGCTNIQTATIPWRSISSIPKNTLKTVTITSGSIGDYAFRECNGLQEVTIGDGVTSIGNSAFYNCTGLQKVTIGDGVTSIGNSAFYNCTGLQEVTIGAGVTSIGKYAFEECTGITKVNVTSLKAWCEIEFEDHESNPLYVGSKAKLYLNDGLVTEVKDLDGLARIPFGAFYGLTDITTVTIPDSVTSIGYYAFYGCSNITKVNVLSLNAWCEIEFGSASSNPLYAANNAKLYGNNIEVAGALEIPAGTTKIVDDAFYKQTGITSITIPDSVTSIGEDAFKGCTGIITATCPASAIRSIPQSHLTTVAITSGGIGGSAFSGCTSLQEVTIWTGVTSIGRYAFYNCSGLQEVTIGAGVTSIGEYAFRGCTGITKVNVTSLKAWCEIKFEYDDSYPLKASENAKLYVNNIEVAGAVEIPAGTTKIGGYAFCGLTGITSVTIPDSVTSIGSGAFSGCTNIQTATMPGFAIPYIPENQLKIVTIISGSVGREAFKNCTTLQEVTLGAGVTSIGEYAFSGCTGITRVNCEGDLKGWCEIDFGSNGSNPIAVASGKAKLYVNNKEITGAVEIPTGTTKIGNYAFYGYSGITSITIPDSVTSIGDSAFKSCTGLREVTIPDSVTSIGGGAFYNCIGLQEVTIGDGVTSIGSNAFYNCTGITKVNVASLKGWCEIAFGNHYANPLYQANYNKAGTAKLYLNDGLVTEVKDLDGLAKIPDYAFYECTDITTVTIPDSVASIGGSAFYNCTGITKVNVASLKGWCEIAFGNCYANPLVQANNNKAGTAKLYLNDGLVTEVKALDGLVKIPAYAFYGCTDITTVTIPDSVTSIGECAFYNCTGLQEVTIGDGVTSIGDAAFRYCTGLQEVTIGAGVTSIGQYAFDYCCSLTRITYQGTTQQWQNLQKGHAWNYDTGGYTVYCTNGTVSKSGVVTPNA